MPRDFPENGKPEISRLIMWYNRELFHVIVVMSIINLENCDIMYLEIEIYLF